MQFKINLATRTYLHTKRINLFIAVFLFLSLAILLFNLTAVLTKRNEIVKLNAQLAEQNVKLKPVSSQFTEKQFSSQMARITYANGLIQRKSLNWLGLLNRLESLVPDGVAITSIEPDLKEGQLKISGDARSFKNLRSFMEHLEDSGTFIDPYLHNQTESAQATLPNTTSFQLSCRVEFNTI